LSYIRKDGDGIAIGATTRQCVMERDALVAAELPLLARAIPYIGHSATRARGTVGGSLANADPAAELSLIAVTLDAVLSYRQGGKTGTMPARDFFVGAMTTNLPAGACLTGVRFPIWRGEKIGTGFDEVNARRSDFAFVAAAAQVELDAGGKCQRIAIGVGAATDFPIRLEAAEKRLQGTALDTKAVDAAVRDALAGIEPLSDLHASTGYRRRAAVSLAIRAVADARASALETKAQRNADAH
jgi:CO/xanthine dehydrogenase FAD-binding subunit